MSAARKTDRESRRRELVSTAARIFAQKSVAGTPVSDIVRAAGVAQGTFYLYFASKADIVNAVVERIADQLIDSIEQAVRAAGDGAAAQMLALRDAMLAIGSDPETWELAQIYHRPENRATHDRMADRVLVRLAPLVEGIVRQGVAEGVFVVKDPRVAAWFVLGSLHVLELAFSNPTELSAAIADTTECALRALGYTADLGDTGPKEAACPMTPSS